MFTGIVEGTGTIKRVLPMKDMHRLDVLVSCKLEGLKIGDSVSVSGVCLTVVEIEKTRLSFDVMNETISKTSLRYARPNAVVNIERALKMGSRLDGHFVLGHIDAVSRIERLRKESSPYLDLMLSPEDTEFVVSKGSIAIDGISLTVGEVSKNTFKVHLIPYTLVNTNLKFKRALDVVNVEFDVLGKYALKRNEGRQAEGAGISESHMKDVGFI